MKYPRPRNHFLCLVVSLQWITEFSLLGGAQLLTHVNQWCCTDFSRFRTSYFSWESQVTAYDLCRSLYRIWFYLHISATEYKREHWGTGLLAKKSNSLILWYKQYNMSIFNSDCKQSESSPKHLQYRFFFSSVISSIGVLGSPWREAVCSYQGPCRGGTLSEAFKPVNLSRILAYAVWREDYSRNLFWTSELLKLKLNRMIIRYNLGR